ncbi:MAG: hypothetical protein JJE25_04525 [Bacteroidia bacterium]|nr:hypothetical protein [Bacteroidia bacterium]
MRQIFSFLLASLLMVISFSCKKGNEYPIEPEIKFKSLTTEKDGQGKDIYATLTISFTDGDGDIGADDGNNNFIVGYYRKQNNIWTLDASYDYSGRIKVVTSTGKSRALRGDISYDIDQAVMPQGAVNDTVRFNVYIYDRAQHQSNTVTTSEIVINTY